MCQIRKRPERIEAREIRTRPEQLQTNSSSAAETCKCLDTTPKTECLSGGILVPAITAATAAVVVATRPLFQSSVLCWERQHRHHSVGSTSHRLDQLGSFSCTSQVQAHPTEFEVKKKGQSKPSRTNEINQPACENIASRAPDQN